MALERTLSIIKPDAVKKNAIGQILARFEKAGLRIVAARMKHLSRAEGPILLVGREPDLPYNRPPCSKGYLQGTESREDTLFRPAAWYGANADWGVTAKKIAALVRRDRTAA